jgi:hypothetical protein
MNMGRPFQIHVAWARLRATRLWQAIFIRPFPPEEKLWWARSKSALAYAFGLVLILAPGALLIDDALNAPMPLERMQATNGTLTRVTISRRTASYLELATPSGEERRFYARQLRHANTRLMRAGLPVTVWSQPGFELFRGQIDKAFEIRLDATGGYILNYMEGMPRHIESDENDHYWLGTALLFGIFLITRPIWKHRKQTADGFSRPQTHA